MALSRFVVLNRKRGLMLSDPEETAADGVVFATM